MVKLFGRNTSIYSAFEIKRRFPTLRLHRHGNHTHFNCNFVGAHTSKDQPKQLVSWQREEKYQQQMSTLNSIRVKPKGTPHRFAIGSLLNQTSSNRSLSTFTTKVTSSGRSLSRCECRQPRISSLSVHPLFCLRISLLYVEYCTYSFLEDMLVQLILRQSDFGR